MCGPADVQAYLNEHDRVAIQTLCNSIDLGSIVFYFHLFPHSLHSPITHIVQMDVLVTYVPNTHVRHCCCHAKA